VARGVVESGVADRVIVATDDERIAEAVAGTGAETHLCDRPFACGTDRVAEAVQGQVAADDAVINVQGDEPLVDEAVLRAALTALQGNDVGTVAIRPAPGQDLADPDIVKINVDTGGQARTFDRAWDGDEQGSLTHVGVYAFRGESLQRFAGLAPSANERRLKLEQLRALDAGMSVGGAVLDGTHTTASVNRPHDVPLVEQLLVATSAGVRRPPPLRGVTG